MNRRSTSVPAGETLTEPDNLVLEALDFDIPCDNTRCGHSAAWKYTCTGCGASWLCCEPHRQKVFMWVDVMCVTCDLRADRIWDIFKWSPL